jgi:hypothetical protein
MTTIEEMDRTGKCHCGNDLAEKEVNDSEAETTRHYYWSKEERKWIHDGDDDFLFEHGGTFDDMAFYCAGCESWTEDCHCNEDEMAVARQKKDVEDEVRRIREANLQALVS